MQSNFKALLIWMDRWGVISPEAQRDFLVSFDAAYEEQEWPTVADRYLRASIARHRDIADVLAEVRQRDERENERVLAEADHRRRRVWPRRKTAALGLFLLWYLGAMFGGSGLQFAAVFLAVFLPWSYRRSVKRAEKSIEEEKENKPYEYGPSLRTGSRRNKFDIPFSTEAHPQARFKTLAHGKRTCSRCGNSPPGVWLTVSRIDAPRAQTRSPVHDAYNYKVICTGCLSNGWKD